MSLQQINIDLRLNTSDDECQEFELRVPVDMLYCGFKISFLATERLENILFKLVELHTKHISRNWGSHSLEELLLSLPVEGLQVAEEEFSLRISRTTV